MSGSGKDESPIGRDEMNLAEFPITLLTDQPPKGIKTLTFESRHGKLTVAGSDDYGLPTAPDADVIVGLIQLTKLRNNFTGPSVSFSRYELLKLLGWEDVGRNYRRLDDSLRRWVGVTLRYDKCWWDNEIKCRVDANFHMLDNVLIYDQEVRRKLRERQQPLPLSSFTWGSVFFKSFSDDNIKKLDIKEYMSLRSSISKRLYRFLDKRFYLRSDWTFDLRELAFDHVGLSRNYTAAKVKEKLQPALDELEGSGFIRAMDKAERYSKAGRGEWRIRLVRKLASAVKSEDQRSDLEHELVIRGMTASTAREVVRNFPEERVRAQIERADWLRAKKPKKIADLGAYLVSAIRDDYAPPAGFEDKEGRARREAADQERRQREAAARSREREAAALVSAFWKKLTPVEQAKLEAEALERAEPTMREGCDAGPPVVRKMIIRAIREVHIRRLLDLPPSE